MEIWITDITVAETNVFQLSKGGRARFQAAVKKAGSRARWWRRRQSILTELYVPSWEDFFLWIFGRSKNNVTAHNTS